MPAPYTIPPLGTLERYPTAVRQWEDVYTSARDRGFSQPRAAMQAWGAIRHAGYYKDAAGVWRKPKMAKTKKRKSSKRKSSKRKASKRKASKRKASKRKASKRKTAKKPKASLNAALKAAIG